MSAPTEAELRWAVAGRLRTYDGAEDKLHEAIDKALDAIAYVEFDDDKEPLKGAVVESAFWTDLRPSEADRLSELTHAARTRLMESLWTQIVDAAVEAGVTFAAEYPDAPRAKVLEPA